MPFELKRIETLVDEVESLLERRIATRQLNWGDQLPSERELAAELRVSRATVREAISRLICRRLVSKDTRRGIYVSRAWEAASLDTFVSFALASAKDGRGVEHLAWTLELRRFLYSELLGMAMERGAPLNDLEKECRTVAAMSWADSLKLAKQEVQLIGAAGAAADAPAFMFTLTGLQRIYEEFPWKLADARPVAAICERVERTVELLPARDGREVRRLTLEGLTREDEEMLRATD